MSLLDGVVPKYQSLENLIGFNPVPVRDIDLSFCGLFETVKSEMHLVCGELLVVNYSY